MTEVLKSLFLERSSRHFQWLQGYGRLMLRDTHVASELAARNSKDEDILESDALTGTVPTAEGEADVEADVGDALFEWQEALGSCTAPMLLPHLFSLERCRQRLVLHQHALLVLMEGMEDEEYEGQSNRDLLLVFMPFVNTTDGEVPVLRPSLCCDSSANLPQVLARGVFQTSSGPPYLRHEPRVQKGGVHKIFSF